MALPAAADQGDTLNLTLSKSVSFDRNVLLLPSRSPSLPGYSSKSDRIDAESIGLSVNKSYGQQTFQVSATDTTTRYNNFSYLGFDGFNYRAAWLWHLSPRLSGTLSTEQTESLVPFTDYRGFQRNVKKEERRNFNLDGWIGGAWHVLAGVSSLDTNYQQQTTPLTTYTSKSGEAGLKYLAASGSYLAFVQRLTDVTYDRPPQPATLQDDQYLHHESELQTKWIASGHSVLNARLTWTDQNWQNYAQRNFSGLGGRVAYEWTPTGKLQLKLSATRIFSTWVDLGGLTANSSYKVDDTLSFEPTWQVDAKTVVRLGLSHMTSDYLGSVFADPRPVRYDTVNTARASVDWSPLRSLTVSASMQYFSRSSTNPGLVFNDTVGNISAQLMF